MEVSHFCCCLIGVYIVQYWSDIMMVGALVSATSPHPPEKSDPVSELGRWLNPSQVTQDRQVKLPAPMSASQLFSSSCFSRVVERAQCVCVCVYVLRMCENWRSDNARRLLLLLPAQSNPCRGWWAGRKLCRLWPQLPQVPGGHFGGVWKLHVELRGFQPWLSQAAWQPDSFITVMNPLAPAQQ